LSLAPAAWERKKAFAFGVGYFRGFQSFVIAGSSLRF